MKIADMATGTGIWLLDVAKTLPSTCTFTGYDVSPSCFPPESARPKNVAFKVQDMLLPFPKEDLATFDVVAVRFVSAATTRTEWGRAIDNLLTLLKPDGYLQWIDSCNLNIYNTVAGTSRTANQEIYDALDAFKMKEDLIIGMMIREPRRLFREKVLMERGMADVHEDVFSSDRIHSMRELGTRNMIMCFKQYLEDLVAIEGSGWTREKVERVCGEALREVDRGVYYTLDQVCIVGRKL
jgi:SAM-dependent methyltransferase